MPWYLKKDETKIEKIDKKPVLHIRCGCAICEKCWFRPDVAHCVYGGPFSGYEEIKDK